MVNNMKMTVEQVQVLLQTMKVKSKEDIEATIEKHNSMFGAGNLTLTSYEYKVFIPDSEVIDDEINILFRSMITKPDDLLMRMTMGDKLRELDYTLQADLIQVQLRLSELRAEGIDGTYDADGEHMSYDPETNYSECRIIESGNDCEFCRLNEEFNELDEKQTKLLDSPAEIYTINIDNGDEFIYTISLREHYTNLLQAIADVPTVRCVVNNGFPEQVEMNFDHWEKYGDKLIEAFPLVKVDILDKAPYHMYSMGNSEYKSIYIWGFSTNDSTVTNFKQTLPITYYVVWITECIQFTNKKDAMDYLSEACLYNARQKLEQRKKER